MDVGIDDVGERPNQLILEMMLTLWDRLDPEGLESSRQSVLRSGNIIGFQITLIDGDENAFGLYAITESLPEERYNTDVFVDGELLPCDLPGCSQNTTAVRNDSWAKIKISLNTR